MAFNIDKQTIDELNLQGKFRQGSVHHLFNRVKTRGGEQLLDTMFRHPLTDAAAINERSRIFLYFQQNNRSFPFDVQQINGMREYLDISASKNAAWVLAGVLTRKMLSSLTRDERYKKIIQGLQATIVVLNKCQDLVQSFSSEIHPYAGQVKAVKAILSDKRLEK